MTNTLQGPHNSQVLLVQIDLALSLGAPYAKGLTSLAAGDDGRRRHDVTVSGLPWAPGRRAAHGLARGAGRPASHLLHQLTLLLLPKCQGFGRCYLLEARNHSLLLGRSLLMGAGNLGGVAGRRSALLRLCVTRVAAVVRAVMVSQGSSSLHLH